jgi:hypothetical protein
VQKCTAGILAGRYDLCPMVESNQAEERLARIEHMLEAFQREAVVAKVITAKLVKALVVLEPTVPLRTDR